jgi:hypothetical protein
LGLSFRTEYDGTEYDGIEYDGTEYDGTEVTPSFVVNILPKKEAFTRWQRIPY